MTLNNPIDLISLKLLGVGVEVSTHTAQVNHTEGLTRFVEIELTAVVWRWGNIWKVW